MKFMDFFFWISRSKRTNNHSVEWLFKNIRYLGHVFDFDLRSFDNYIIFQDLLDIIDVNNETNLFDTQEKFEFRVSCDLYIVHYTWIWKWSNLKRICLKISYTLNPNIISWHRNVKTYLCDADLASLKLNVWNYLNFAKLGMDIAAFSIMCANFLHYPLKSIATIQMQNQ